MNSALKKKRSIEIRERAVALLGVHSPWNQHEIQQNFRRQMKLVNPNGPQRLATTVPGHNNEEIARLLIQAYAHLMGRHCPTTMLEDDALVGTLLDGKITPIDQTTTDEQWHILRYYDQFQNSIWADTPSLDDEQKSKFGGIC